MLFNLDNLIFLLTFLLYFEKAKSQSNVVVIVVDDLGIGDLGCFGNTTVKTPNIDALCQVCYRVLIRKLNLLVLGWSQTNSSCDLCSTLHPKQSSIVDR